MKEYEQEEKSEHVAKEPEAAYLTNPCVNEFLVNADLDFDDTLTTEEMESMLKAFFAEQRELFANQPIPQGYLTLEEAHKLSKKHLEDLYAQKKTDTLN